MLVEFAERQKFKIMNTFFKKRLNRRWTWISPNGATKNEKNGRPAEKGRYR